MDFIKFKTAVAKQFDKLKQGELFRTGISKDALWEVYLQSFPSGTNPLYKERTEHDCNCCKQFIRTVGNVVAIVDGKLETIWDIEIDVPHYQEVANQLANAVRMFAIENEFLHFENTAGTDHNHQQTEEGIKTWSHFFVTIPKKFVMKNDEIATKLGITKSFFDVCIRSLSDISKESIDTVLELVAQKSLYRGDEHLFVLNKFKALKVAFEKLPKSTGHRELFVWELIKDTPTPILKVRNTVIGTLLTDISEGMELDAAVRSFESKVAPTNYKRPTALITKGMIESAKAKIEELGLTSALSRRYAKLDDITVNNILFANRESRKVIDGNIFDTLVSQTTEKIKNLDTIEEVSIDRFLGMIVPNSTSIEVLLENNHNGNLVSLIAPVDANSGHLFKWDNNFSWSYAGEVTDSIKERVKAAGGNTSGDLCCRLAWYNLDDLDLHLTEPDGNRIYFGKSRNARTGGYLDVDMNRSATTREPVENIAFADKSKMREGVYKLEVHNFRARETNNIGFEVDIDFLGTITKFHFESAVKDGQTIQVASFKFSVANGIEFLDTLPSTQTSKEMWELTTRNFHKVNVLMYSPNYWDDAVSGNKHYFFMLDKCINPDTTRGFYNEFLKSELDVHRKVFEVVGSNMKVEESQEQLSGLGFSSTQKGSIVVRVEGSFSRVLKVIL